MKGVSAFFRFAFFIASIFFRSLSSLPDLADMTDDFVLETKRIVIPEYPYAFNPSIIRLKDSLLLSFRIVPDPKEKFNCRIGLVRLDENFEPIGKPQLLETADAKSGIPARIDDARLIAIGERLWLVYADNKEQTITRGGFRVYIGELIEEGDRFVLLDQECLSRFQGENKNVREKNWVPFDYQGTMLLAYSLNPHRILFPEIGTGTCTSVALSEVQSDWNLGELRGGTPALLIEEDLYLAFFHTAKNMQSVQSYGKKTDHYFIGAYTFSASPPFGITAMSGKPIVGRRFYENDRYIPYWKPVTVVFPCGFIFDQDFIWIAYGQHDHESWIAKLDKKKLMESLIPANPL